MRTIFEKVAFGG